MKLKQLFVAGMFAAGAILSAGAGALAAPASTGTDLLETFESYRGDTFLRGIWKSEAGSKNAIETFLDTKTSAPNRGDGKAKGNYRSMRVEVDTSKNDNWGFFRGTTEENSTLTELAKKGGEAYLSFWAKADKPGIQMKVALNMEDKPFAAPLTTLTTEWKEYKINLRDFRVQSNFGSVKEGTNMFEVTEAGFNGVDGGWAYGHAAYLVGYKIDFLETQGTVWMDTLSFTGEHIQNVTKTDAGQDTKYDEDGDVPRDFQPGGPTTPPVTQPTGTPPTTPPTKPTEPSVPAPKPGTVIEDIGKLTDAQIKDYFNSKQDINGPITTSVVDRNGQKALKINVKFTNENWSFALHKMLIPANSRYTALKFEVDAPVKLRIGGRFGGVMTTADFVGCQFSNADEVLAAGTYTRAVDWHEVCNLQGTEYNPNGDIFDLNAQSDERSFELRFGFLQDGGTAEVNVYLYNTVEDNGDNVRVVAGDRTLLDGMIEIGEEELAYAAVEGYSEYRVGELRKALDAAKNLPASASMKRVYEVYDALELAVETVGDPDPVLPTEPGATTTTGTTITTTDPADDENPGTGATGSVVGLIAIIGAASGAALLLTRRKR